MFLYYALVMALSGTIPVPWCDDAEFGFLFTSSGVTRFKFSRHPIFPSVTLALFDTFPPGPAFTHQRRDNIYIVQSTPPELVRYRG